MRRALVITRIWSDNPDSATHGIFQRFSLFLDALDAHMDAIDILAFAPDSAHLAELAQRHTALYQHGRQARITVQAVPRTPNPSPWPMLSRYGGGMLSVDRQENYRNIASPHCVAAVAQALQAQPAVVLAHRLPAFTPLLPALGAQRPPILFDMDDIEHRALRRGLMHASRWPSEHLRLLHLPALMLRERTAVRSSVHSFVCSDNDAIALRKLAGCDSVSAIPNAIAAPEVLPAKQEAGHTLGFIGSFVHPPNLDAAQWLLTEMWPRIRAAFPQARVRIAGAGSRAALAQHMGQPGIEVLDFVPDIADFYRGIDVMLAPLRFGAGTRIKIIEAAGYGLPTVATTLGAEGLVLRDGHDIVIADSVSALADQAIRLLGDAGLAQAIGRQARISYEQHYSRDRAVATIGQHVARAVASRN